MLKLLHSTSIHFKNYIHHLNLTFTLKSHFQILILTKIIVNILDDLIKCQ